MKLNRTVYNTTEIAEDKEHGMVVGNIVMDDDKMLYAEVVDCTIFTREELANARAFLDCVEEAMAAGTMSNILNGGCYMQNELDSITMQLTDSRNWCGYLNNRIEELKDQNIKDLRELYDLCKADVHALEEERDFEHIITDTYRSDVEDLKTEVDRLRSIIRCEHKHNADLLEDNKSKFHKIAALETELSMCKEDSKVLTNVVEIVRQWGNDDDRLYPTLYQINTLHRCLADHLDSGAFNNGVGDIASYTVEIDIRCEG